MSNFYVYVYIDPRDGTPFYIGKGKGNRDRHHLLPSMLERDPMRGRFFYRKLRKLLKVDIQPEIRRVCEGISEEEAFFWESFFIHALGRRNLRTGCLCNLTDGGDGVAGMKHSEETRQRISEAKKNMPDETRQKISKAMQGRTLPDKTRQKMSEVRRGRSRSEKTRQKISDAMKNMSQERRRQISRVHKGKRLSEQTKARISFTKWKKFWGEPQPLDAREAVVSMYSEVCRV